MDEKELLIIRRHIELEKYIKWNYPKGKTPDEVIEIFYKKFNNFDDLEYLLYAYRMPIDEIKKDINYYDSQSLLNKPDELEFVSNLMKKYGVEREDIIKRIQDVRKIVTMEKVGFVFKKRKKLKK